MKGICQVWCRGRHFSPSLPGDRYLKHGSKSDLRAEISGSIVRYDALAPRPEVLCSWYFICVCADSLKLKSYHILGKIISRSVDINTFCYILVSTLQHPSSLTINNYFGRLLFRRICNSLKVVLLKSILCSGSTTNEVCSDL